MSRIAARFAALRAAAELPPAATVLVNLSGRGDKDVDALAALEAAA